MDPTIDTSGASGTDTSSWALARLGNAIDVYVDRQLNTPQTLGTYTGYGLDQNGQLYQMGQPTTVQTMSPLSGNKSLPMLLLIGFGLYLVAHHGR